MSPKPLSPIAQALKGELSSDQPWLFLYEIQVPSDPLKRFRLVRDRVELNFRGIVYQPTQATHSGVSEDSEGSLSEVTLSIQNITRKISQMAEQYDMVGQPVRIMLVNTADVPSGAAADVQDFSIAGLEYTSANISLRLGQLNPYRVSIPARIVKRSVCGVLFGGPVCGYIGSLASCDHSFDGPTGCSAKNVDSPQHPTRFNAAAQLPRAGTIGTGLG